jgi:hypothetical protein
MALPQSHPRGPSEPAVNPTLPTDFLFDPAMNLVTQRIDFAQMKLRCYTGLYSLIIDNVLSPSECQTLIEAAESSTDGKWSRAMINIGGGMQRLIEEERCCGRIIWDSQDVMDQIWKRIECLPEVQVGPVFRVRQLPLYCEGVWLETDRWRWQTRRSVDSKTCRRFVVMDLRNGTRCGNLRDRTNACDF